MNCGCKRILISRRTMFIRIGNIYALKCFDFRHYDCLQRLYRTKKKKKEEGELNEMHFDISPT